MRKIVLLIGIISVTLEANAQLIKNFRSGCYYDTSNVKHQGFISKEDPYKNIFKGRGDHIFFRETKDGKKQKITTDELNAVVIKKDELVIDSFVVSHDEDLEKFPFLRVAIIGPVNLYTSTTQSTTSMGGMGHMPATFISYDNIDYYYGTNPDHVTKLKRKNFIEGMSSVMSDKPLIADKIKSGYYRYGDIKDLLEAYKTGVIKAHQYLNEDVN